MIARVASLLSSALQAADTADADPPRDGSDPWATFLHDGQAFLDSLGPWAQAGLILLAAILLARLVDKLVTAIVRVAAAKTHTQLDDALLDCLHGPVVKSVVLIGLWQACHVLQDDNAPALWIHRSIVTLGVLVWCVAVLRLASVTLRGMARNRSSFSVVEPRTLPLFDNLAKVVLVALAAYVLITVWQLDATGWLASAGVAGIALGFAAKDSLANLFAGVFIIADAPYRVGDYVVLDSGYRGKVVHIGLRSTRILTRDDIEITIPNSVIGNGAIVNETSGAPRYRIRVKVGCAYGSDLGTVRRVLLESAEAVPEILEQPEARVRFRLFGDSALEFELLGWIADPELRGRTLDALNSEVYERFQAAGIEIAFPQTDLHVRTWPRDWQALGGDEAAGAPADPPPAG